MGQKGWKVEGGEEDNKIEEQGLMSRWKQKLRISLESPVLDSAKRILHVIMLNAADLIC